MEFKNEEIENNRNKEEIKEIKRYEGYIFDMDGLLLNTEPIYSKCFQQIFEMSNKEWNEQFKTKLLGKREEEVARVCVEEGELNISIDEFRILARDIQHELMSTTTLMNGAYEILQKLSSMNLPLALATSSHLNVMKIKTQLHEELFQVFSVIITGDHSAVKHGKPAPDIFLEAARQLNIDSEKCLVFEDSPTGVRASLAANMDVVWIPDQNLWTKLSEENNDLLNNNHVYIVSSLNEYINQYIIN